MSFFSFFSMIGFKCFSLGSYLVRRLSNAVFTSARQLWRSSGEIEVLITTLHILQLKFNGSDFGLGAEMITIY